MLAATTQGYDVTTYIGHSPGETELVASSDPPTPESVHGNPASGLISTSVGGKLMRQLFIIYYASRTKRVPPQVEAIAIGLVISTPMFIAALVIAAIDFGGSVLGASLKLGLRMGGFLIEVLSHLCLPLYWRTLVWWTNGKEAPDPFLLPVDPRVPLHERLQTITTIVLGEGINGIAGTLSKVLAAPGTGKVVGVNIVSAACTIWCIAYIYFQGPKGETTPAFTNPRYLLWLMLHFPFLASIVLMLIGMKHQFLVTSFLSSLFKTTARFNEEIDALFEISENVTEWEGNKRMTGFLIRRGIVWENELQNLKYTLDNTTEDGQIIPSEVAFAVWTQRFSLTIVKNLFKDFSSDDDILDNLQQNITDYYTNLTQAIDDVNIIYDTNPAADLRDTEYYKILGKLLDGPVLNTRCIIGFAGALLISLSLQDFFHSRPRDRYEFGVIISRFLMGLILCLLLLLNLGKYQELFVPQSEENHRAGIFLWLEAFWVLPTIAIAFGLEFLIEIILARIAKWATEEQELAQVPTLTKNQITDEPEVESENGKMIPDNTTPTSPRQSSLQ
ncbi:unnamed protein product [Rhizoctonia solani]|uniref:Transmembrane protein n=1 Tax=Rhizoctonia solani TaxID=456999 RepID=A0A8H3I0I4_9AGAM|nr:unnamed protein product [Rhizoctonia solani]